MRGISQGLPLEVKASSEPTVGQEEVLALLLTEEEMCPTHTNIFSLPRAYTHAA